MNDWDDLRFFLAVAHAQSFSGAAKALMVNHSTVSRRIHGMEVKHGVKLFNQLPTGYEMTEAAVSIYEQALSIEAANQQISRTLFGQDDRLEGKINLTMPHDIFEHLLAPHIARFCREYPGVELNLLLTEGLRDLAYREADLAVRLTKSPPDYLTGRRVTALKEAIYAPQVPELEGPVGIIVWDNDDDLPPWAMKHFPDAHVVLRVDHLSGMYAAVKAGIGIACMPCYLPDLQKGDHVQRLPFDVPDAHWSLWVLNHIDLKNTTRVMRCRKMLLDALKQDIAVFTGQERAH